MSVAIVWGIAWGAIAAAYAFVAHFFGTNTDIPLRTADIPQVGRFYGLVGAWSGAVFAIVLAATERRRTFGQLSMWRTILWGVLGAVSLPLLTFPFDGPGVSLSAHLQILAFVGGLGVLSSWAMLAIARRASAGSRAELGSGPPPEAPAGSRDREAARAPY